MKDLPALWELAKKFKISLALGLIGALLIGFGILSPTFNNSKSEPVFERSTDNQATESKIKVDVSGSVKNPSVYELAQGARIENAIEAAGGYTNKADKNWVARNLNLAQTIQDGAKLYIPKVDEFTISSSLNGSSLGSSSVVGKVNINSASSSELDTLPRVGPVTAQKIIDSRPYTTVDDLLNKGVLGPKTFEGLKDFVSVQ